MKLPYTIKQIESFIKEYNSEFTIKMVNLNKEMQKNISIYEKLENTQSFQLGKYTIIKETTGNRWYIIQNTLYYNFKNNAFEDIHRTPNEPTKNYYSTDIIHCLQMIKNIYNPL